MIDLRLIILCCGWSCSVDVDFFVFLLIPVWLLLWCISLLMLFLLLWILLLLSMFVCYNCWLSDRCLIVSVLVGFAFAVLGLLFFVSWSVAVAAVVRLFLLVCFCCSAVEVACFVLLLLIVKICVSSHHTLPA